MTRCRIRLVFLFLFLLFGTIGFLPSYSGLFIVGFVSIVHFILSYPMTNRGCLFLQC
ncbi:hypothetical protein BDQ94DRAFT_133978 [Aspergillus welwitschiae]|uniref:Uncharacterized protein n=1 Tax=Aspergillus welwitschiae TaxID=1341132 RepID=A0A3F3QHQ7_9EURO|nr:hypothetical protein BDQ94DRAFT_133978 [Aspergillus welwitschiae]RDH38489.1 hypothetical protein BDQ94DRAFT_133978 [Aspergillus welwitschiae]